MEYSVDKINSILRPALKSRIGTQANINGARAFAQKEWKATSLSAGQLAYALVLEAAYWSDMNIYGVAIPENCLDQNTLQMIGNICAKADSTHGKGSKAAAGAAVGSYFGLLGAVVGGVFGWALGQNAANNDIENIILYANQAIDYMCDSICNGIRLLSAKSKNSETNKQIENQPAKPAEIRKTKEGYPKFSDVIGLEEAKQAIQERIIDPSKHPDIYKKYGYKSGGGILLYGLPGTGKTMFAQAVANELDGKFFSIKASDLKSKYYGETEEKIKSLFSEARKEKVAVIFIDEFETIGMDRSKQTNDLTGTTVVPELLAQMQGFEQDGDNMLLVIAATNRPWDIDSALTRPGRLDYKVYVELPNEECRKAMFNNYLNKINIMTFALETLCKKTEGYNGADIKNVSDALVKIVIKKEIDGIESYHIDYSDVENVLSRIKSSVSIKDVYQMEAFRSQK